MTAEARPVPIDGFAGVRLEAPGGKLAAVVVPSLAMLCCSLTHRGTELLGQRGGVKAYAETGSTMGIPLLHPWANRLSDLAAAGVRTPAGSDLLRIDAATGLPIHGLRLRGASRTSTTATDGERAVVTGDLDLADEPELATAFPFPHRLRVRHALDDGGWRSARPWSRPATWPCPWRSASIRTSRRLDRARAGS